MQISPARSAAFEILLRVEQEDSYSSALLAAADEDLNAKDRGLCHELVLGVLRQRLWLDRAIEHFAARKIDKLDLPVTQALRLGLYQLRFLTRIPPSAAVNESVNLIRAARLKSAASFANAVLRRATREPDYDPAASIDDPIEQLAVETSHPLWLAKRWISQIGFEEAALLAHANNLPAPLVFRFTAKARSEEQRNAMLDELKRAGVEVRGSSIAADAWRLRRVGVEGQGAGKDAGEPHAGMPALRQLSEQGLIYFQDEGSQMVAQLVGARESQAVLDVCAAPGSKATLIAALAPETFIVAGDLYEHRVRTTRDFAKCQQAHNLKSIVYDATRELPFPDGFFDRVLVDAPCSGTGTLRQNPEIRWRLQPSDIAELSLKQKDILLNAASMVRRGGILVYSTCSVEPEENESVIEQFSGAHPNFERVPLNIPSVLLTDYGAVRTWPHRDGVDGFFIAALQRKL